MRIHADRSAANEAAKNYRGAYDQLLKYNELNDSLFSLEKNETLEALREQYEAREKQARIDSLLMEKEYMTLKSREEAALRNVLLLGAVILLLPVVILLFVYQQKLRSEQKLAVIREEANIRRVAEQEHLLEVQSLKAGMDAQERERERVSSGLQDHVVFSLSEVKLSLAEMVKDKNMSSLGNVLDTLDNAYHEVRTLSHHLASPVLLNTGFPGQMKKYLDEISEINDLDVTMSLQPETRFRELSQEIQTEIYRIVQECVNNVVKHANASHIDLNFTCYDGNMTLMVEDDGDGFDPALVHAGVGLQTVRSRVNLLNGDLHIDSVPGRGTLVTVQLPADRGLKSDHRTGSNEK